MDMQTLLRSLPKVNRLLERDDLKALAEVYPRVLVADAVRETLDALREEIRAGGEPDVSEHAVAARAAALAERKARRSLRRVVNATGIVVHTNLGRSCLAKAAVDAVAEVSGAYSTLEYDVEAGERGSRHVHVEELICRLTGAEAAMAVNNNAAAVLLSLAGLARGKRAIVSRGQLVEIGGSFRVPDVMRESGAVMVEVGTTNKTHLRDYENAITPDTGLLLKVHTSNYRVVGFTQEVSLEELVELGARHGVPVMEDQGSGVLVDLREWGLPYEPTIGESVAAGADVVTCSGDKLLGGPQAGIIAGKWHVVQALKKHPMARAVRLDKMTLAALEVTLRLYLDPDRARREIPTLRMLSASVEEMRERAERFAARITEACGDAYAAGTAPDVSRAGGGALPMADIPTVVTTVVPSRMSVAELEARLRCGEPPIVARISDERLLLDPRTLLDGDEEAIVSALAALAR
ncbi:selenocysteinyl-tRNA(Sec) synthase [Coriobacteriaceae bacterium EMTCatB1]|nr:selenocysteinyl-tRNA(Sec) synthase [Coriobacteriaceae bacterium EMTCatB1]